MRALWTAGFFFISLPGLAATCMDGSQMEARARDQILNSSDGSVYNHIKNSDRLKTCYEIGVTVGKVRAASNFFWQCGDIKTQSLVTKGVADCNAQLDKLRAACGDLLPITLSPAERMGLTKDFFTAIRPMVVAANKCLEEKMWATVKKARPGQAEKPAAGKAGAALAN